MAVAGVVMVVCFVSVVGRWSIVNGKIVGVICKIVRRWLVGSVGVVTVVVGEACGDAGV